MREPTVSNFVYGPLVVPAEGQLSVAGQTGAIHCSAVDHRPAWWRLFEATVALAVLVTFLPIAIAIAILIRRGSPGPALFWQQRVAKNGRLFWFVKFRTMYVDARTQFKDLYRYKYSEEELAGLRFKVERDPRVTREGAWLRRSTLDELPNFFNVLTGDMALVGPRPEIPEMLKYYKGEMWDKFSVPPGVTGLAQCSGRGELKFHETVDLDLEYVRRRSWQLDLWIIWRTFVGVLTREGAY